MANLSEYAKLARAAYKDEAEAQQEAQGWNMQIRRAATLTMGFQGAVFDNGREIIVAFKGTAPGKKSMASDISADVVLFLNGIPSQVDPAEKLVRQAYSIAGGKQISLTGHSLGGALCQVVGYWYSLPFVTFNAPPMMSCVQLAPLTAFSPLTSFRQAWRSIKGKGPPEGKAINYMVRSDIVSGLSIRDHVGKEIRIKNSTKDGDHAMNTMIRLLSGMREWNQPPW